MLILLNKEKNQTIIKILNAKFSPYTLKFVSIKIVIVEKILKTNLFLNQILSTKSELQTALLLNNKSRPKTQHAP